MLFLPHLKPMRLQPHSFNRTLFHKRQETPNFIIPIQAYQYLPLLRDYLAFVPDFLDSAGFAVLVLFSP